MDLNKPRMPCVPAQMMFGFSRSTVRQNTGMASRDGPTRVSMPALDACQVCPPVAQSDWGTNKFAVCGVYVGWRGASIRHFAWFTVLAEYLSFWSRKSVAEKIASTPASAALFGLTDVARSTAPDPTNNPARIVLAGHSFGAGILMNSVSQALAYEYARAASEAKRAGS